MRETTPSFWVRTLPVALFLLLLAGAAGSALAVIRLREEAGRLAANTTQLRTTMGETTRLFQEMGAAMAAAQQPEVLRARVGNRLAPMTEKQIVWVRAIGATPRAEVAAPPAAPAISPRLAFLEPVSGSSLLR